MPKHVIHIEGEGQSLTVSQMRRQLAKTLSRLDGGQSVRFTFHATIPNYQAAALPMGWRGGEVIRAYGELAATDPTEQP